MTRGPTPHTPEVEGGGGFPPLCPRRDLLAAPATQGRTIMLQIEVLQQAKESFCIPESMSLKNVIRFIVILIHMSSCFGRSGKMFSPGFLSVAESLPSWPLLSAGISVTAAFVLSLFLIFEHLCAYHQPEEQKFLIGLILMVPVYAVQSFFSLLNSNVAFICELMRDCYEAFAMYCFERYLIACLGGEESTIRFMEGQFQISESSPMLDVGYDYGIVKHPFPLNWFMRNWYLGPDFYHAVKIGIVQYMILKPICAVLAIFLQLLGIYGEGKFGWRYGYPYLAIVLLLHFFFQLGFLKDIWHKGFKRVFKIISYALRWGWLQWFIEDPEEERGIDNITIMQASRPDARDRRLSFRQSVRDVVLGSGEIMVDDVKYTVSHVVEPMERSFSKINQRLHQISENVKQLEKQKRKAKDDSDVPLETWSEEFAEAHDHVFGGSVSDSGLARKKYRNPKGAPSSLKPIDFGRWF
ncbi:hypothetical protein GUJ93_ZPchr0005g15858 [Zizania palustris]|uniref:Uncharacterized protein n=1 Tax=Zizania palustris TaxID=103762 RepID=A0A8J5SWB4_ZIZPA|nr:hypothetical protein GUJ93_ZPchr0005g15858 [Zizania palustris]